MSTLFMPKIFRKICKQAAGKARRFLLLRFRKSYVTEQIEQRQGECNQCGNCCEILFQCPFLIKLEGDQSFCSIYEDRPGQCGAFPIDEKCLADVGFDCTYSFAREGVDLLHIEPIMAAGMVSEISVNAS